MTTLVEFDTYILGGLSVHVRAYIAPAEPDVGIFFPHLDDLELGVYGKNGKCKPAWPSLYDKLGEDDMERLKEEAYSALYTRYEE